MPSRDSNGKPLSGAAKRKRAKATQEEETKRKQKPVTGGLDFSDLEPPNLEESAFHVSWWNKALMVCADKVIRDPEMPLEKKLKFMSEFAAKAGMLRDKAAEQEKIKQALGNKNDKKTALGLEDVSKLPPPAISRPAR